MSRSHIFSNFLSACVLSVGISTLQAATPEKPNVIVILADDLGFSDLGCYGSEIETPRLDALAQGGVKMSQFYNAARCCPSRASLMTGLYPHQAGVGFMTYGDWGPGYEGSLSESGVTMAELLKTQGYATFGIGKWHIAAHSNPPAHSLPENRGFDRSTMVRTHIDSYWKVLSGCDVFQDGKLLIKGDNEVTDLMNPYQPEKEFYITEYFTDVALDYVGGAIEEKKPFFLYLAYNAPHFPLEAPDETIEKYEKLQKDPEWIKEFGAGWDAMREKKLERQKQLGVVPAGQTLPVVKNFNNRSIMNGLQTGTEHIALPKWGDLPADVQREMVFRRAIYNAQIDNMDENIGRLVDYLKTQGAYENTLILFMSDNGSSGEMGVFGTHFEGGKYDWTEGRFEKGEFIPGGKQEKDAWATRDRVGGKGYSKANYDVWKKESGWATSQGQGWAAYSNAPFKKFKKFAHEGGIASPLIAHWPKGLKQRGVVKTQGAYHFIDVMPTVLEAAGVQYPSSFHGKPRVPLEGQSMLCYLNSSKETSPERSLFWQHETHAAVRAGKWKIVTDDDRGTPIVWELYDMSKDRSESNDLAAQFPEVVEKLGSEWLAFAQRANVVPFPETRK